MNAINTLEGLNREASWRCSGDVIRLFMSGLNCISDVGGVQDIRSISLLKKEKT